ncbi:MAG: hypothetical protein HYV63_02380 [Candidatus Schekmanbacteria bacterium]|nr:hypothetical protein [Candidatus Schekmanbacteria bacterium]
MWIARRASRLVRAGNPNLLLFHSRLLPPARVVSNLEPFSVRSLDAGLRARTQPQDVALLHQLASRHVGLDQQVAAALVADVGSQVVVRKASFDAFSVATTTASLCDSAAPAVTRACGHFVVKAGPQVLRPCAATVRPHTGLEIHRAAIHHLQEALGLGRLRSHVIPILAPRARVRNGLRLFCNVPIRRHSRILSRIPRANILAFWREMVKSTGESPSAYRLCGIFDSIPASVMSALQLDSSGQVLLIHPSKAGEEAGGGLLRGRQKARPEVLIVSVYRNQSTGRVILCSHRREPQPEPAAGEGRR